MDWILGLALTTFVLLMGFLYWNRTSTKRHQKHDGQAAGVGGPNDPISGAGADVREPDQLRASLDKAASGLPDPKPSFDPHTLNEPAGPASRDAQPEMRPQPVLPVDGVARR